MASETLSDIALITPGTSPKGELINSEGLGLQFFQGSKEFQAFYPRAERFTEFPVKVAKKNDILISVRAPVGQVNLAPQDVAIGRGVMSVRPKQDSDRFFIFYLLKWLEGRWDSLGSTGSVFENLSVSALSAVEIPKVEHREIIGRALFQLDCKVQENTRLSRTLEQIAQTIFKSWFIDFDPVKAKMAGEKPADMDDATAALFPDSMEDSELGPIPMGWKLTKVEDVLERVKVKHLPKSTELISLGKTLVLEQGGSLIAGFVNDVATVQSSTSDPHFIFGDHTCRMHLSTIPFSVFPNTIVLTSNSTNPYWAYWSTRDIQNFESYRRHWMELAFRKVVVPSREISNKWGEFVSGIHTHLDGLMIQSRQLAAVQDALLPRLISGELQIPEEMLVL